MRLCIGIWEDFKIYYLIFGYLKNARIFFDKKKVKDFIQLLLKMSNLFLKFIYKKKETIKVGKLNEQNGSLTP